MDTPPVTNQFRGSQVHEPTPDTPYHKRRREDMHTRTYQYGFYPVVSGPILPNLCSNCEKDLTGSVDWIKINGIPICGVCLADARN